MLTRAKSSTFYVNFAAFCVFIDVFLADIIYVFCNRCNCKLLIISHLDKKRVPIPVIPIIVFYIPILFLYIYNYLIIN